MKYLLTITLITLLTACGGGSDGSSDDGSTDTTNTPADGSGALPVMKFGEGVFGEARLG